MKVTPMEIVIAKLNPIFCDVFDDESLIITPQSSAVDIDGWDSLAHIRLIVSVEKLLNIRFDTPEVAELKNVGEMAALIIKKQNAI